MNWPNQAHLNSRFIIWSERAAIFHIVLRVPVEAGDVSVLLARFYEEVEQYANGNSCEWLAVNMPIVDAITEDCKYADCCIEIQHRELWRQYDCVVRSKDKLSKYLEILEQEGFFKVGSTIENEREGIDGNEESSDNEGRNSVNKYKHDAYKVHEDKIEKIADEEADVENQIGGTALENIAQAESVDDEGQYDGKSHCNGVSCNDDYNIDYTEHNALKKQADKHREGDDKADLENQIGDERSINYQIFIRS
ncbi:hypothetical protein FisN_14Lh105 [Fistulifera solaris]|uniref:Uncharacterized protein n=1 Tax=Fistulifera solaris TaxID=1519565 RepID=A0A1Z5J9B7_FISSO|nr:hypothetical protein FisN_14Lh105 [Fistulifera solaris]|eukprot:GAX10603.1 hypothetical protein FisN_14Lh105 [Fistulifera solaris]